MLAGYPFHSNPFPCLLSWQDGARGAGIFHLGAVCSFCTLPGVDRPISVIAELSFNLPPSAPAPLSGGYN